MHGEDVWVLIFCDNLSAHLDQDVNKYLVMARCFSSIFSQYNKFHSAN